MKLIFVIWKAAAGLLNQGSNGLVGQNSILNNETSSLLM